MCIGITNINHLFHVIMIKSIIRWLNPIFAIGLKRSIQEDDLFAVKNDMRSSSNTEEFSKLWESECKKEKPSVFRVILKMFFGKLIFASILVMLSRTAGR